MLICDSNRQQDEFGYLTVTDCVITGDDVAPYFGYEIPDYKKLGLEEKKIYYVYRPIDEIKDACFSNKPLLSRHLDFSAENYQSKFVIGTIGETKIVRDQNRGTIVFWDQNSIDDLKKGKKYLSAGYLYTPVKEIGFRKNQRYEIRMKDIVANHVALVDNPRYKAAIVADEDQTKKGGFMYSRDGAVEEIKKLMALQLEDEEKDKKIKDILEALQKSSSDKSEEVTDKKDEDLEESEEQVEDEDLENEEQKENDEETLQRSSKSKTKESKKMTGDSLISIKKVKDHIQKLAADAMKKELLKLQKNNLAFDQGIKEYERVCGKVNRMAFDSAESIYDTILKNHKKNILGKSFDQKQAMVEMLPTIGKQRALTRITMDEENPSPKNLIPEGVLKIINGGGR